MSRSRWSWWVFVLCSAGACSKPDDGFAKDVQAFCRAWDEVKPRPGTGLSELAPWIVEHTSTERFHELFAMDSAPRWEVRLESRLRSAVREAGLESCSTLDQLLAPSP